MSGLGEAWKLIKFNLFLCYVGNLRPREKLGLDLGSIVS